MKYMEEQYEWIIARLKEETDNYIEYEYNYEDECFGTNTTKKVLINKDFVISNSDKKYKDFFDNYSRGIKNKSVIDFEMVNSNEVDIVEDLIWALVRGYEEKTSFVESLTIYPYDPELEEFDDYEQLEKEYDEEIKELLLKKIT